MTHLQDDHGMDVQVSDVTCPLCVKFTSGDRDILSLHIARHMEEIALAILPTGVASDDESADQSTSDATSSRDNEDPVTLAGESQEDPTRDPGSIKSNAYGSDTEHSSASVDLDDNPFRPSTDLLVDSSMRLRTYGPAQVVMTTETPSLDKGDNSGLRAAEVKL
jgi:hypothetical protein